MTGTPSATVADAVDLLAAVDLSTATTAGIQSTQSFNISGSLSDVVWLKANFSTNNKLSSGFSLFLDVFDANSPLIDIYFAPDGSQTDTSGMTFITTESLTTDGVGTAAPLSTDSLHWIYYRIYNDTTAMTAANQVDWNFHVPPPPPFSVDINSATDISGNLTSLAPPLVQGAINSHSTVTGHLTSTLHAGVVGTINSKTTTDANVIAVLSSDIFITLAEFDANGMFSHGLARVLPGDATVADQPILFSMTSSASLSLLPPLLEVEEVEALQRRVVPTKVLTLPTPVVINGRPLLPAYVSAPVVTTTALEGPTHIHAIADPDPKWNPATDGWYIPPILPPVAPGHNDPVGNARWTANSLPDPGDGSYWLGDPSYADGTSGISRAARQWGPDPATPHAPAWHSIYPYKPLVANHIHYGAQGKRVITRGVRFNLQFAEHMWMDAGLAYPQPMSWVIVALVMDFPNSGYVHTLLDSGRDPRAVGYPARSDSLPYDSVINDGLDYRTTIQMNINNQFVGTELNQFSGHRLGTAFNMVARPRMFFGVFNGAHSMAGNWSSDGKYAVNGKLATGKQHRYYVMGRRHGHIGMNYDAHLVVFEMRLWNRALSTTELKSQYSQLASTWKFNQY